MLVSAIKDMENGILCDGKKFMSETPIADI